MGRYDAALKLILQKWTSELVQQLAGDAINCWHATEFPQVSTQYADLLAQTASGAYWHLELQATNDETMALRMLEYAIRVRRTYGHFPEQCVLYVGSDPLRMQPEIRGQNLSFSYELVDIRDLNGERLLSSGRAGDSIMAILTGQNPGGVLVRRVLEVIAGLESADRVWALEALLLIAGLRELEETVEQEARKMPVFDDILENKVLGREFRRGLEQGREQGIVEGLHRGEIAILRRLIEKRFGELPAAASERLSRMTPEQLEELSIRVADARSLEDLFA